MALQCPVVNLKLQPFRASKRLNFLALLEFMAAERGLAASGEAFAGLSDLQ
jgi:hypothetical protein